MRMKYEDLVGNKNFARLPNNMVPQLEGYIDQRDGNIVFVGISSRGKKVVTDAYLVLRDCIDENGNHLLVWCRRETRPFFRRLGSVFEVLASVVITATSPQASAILNFAGKGHIAEEIAKFVSNLHGEIDKTGILQLLAKFNQDELLEVHEDLQDAFEDGQFTQTEWKQIKTKAMALQALTS